MEKKEIVVVCFGTPSISGDSLGPTVGSLLVEKYKTGCFVYGTTARPITAKNMDEYLEFIAVAHKNAVMLAVDASLGDEEKMWKYTLRDGVCPAAVGGRKKRVGDVGLLGVVGRRNESHLPELLSANAVKVQNLADKLAFVIYSALESLSAKQACF